MFRGSLIDRRILLILAVSALIGLRAQAITLPPGFADAFVATVEAPTALAFTPDGRLLIASQGGDLKVLTTGGVLLGPPALSLGSRVCANSERGLLGVAVDPAFTANHFVYLYYTFNKNNAGCPLGTSTTSPVERVSRFTLDVPTANVIDAATEVVLVDGVLNFAGNHNGGQLRVGPDGYLYAGIGDGGCDYAVDSGCQGMNDASRDRNILNGKIIRTLAPCRALDTRGPVGPTGGPALQTGGSRDFSLAGGCGIPPDAVAVAANVTVTNTTVAGSLRIAPAGKTPILETVDSGPTRRARTTRSSAFSVRPREPSGFHPPLRRALPTSSST
jgi:hypothetical protein